MASKPAMDGKHRGQVRATSKEDKLEQETRRSSQSNKQEDQAKAKATTPHNRRQPKTNSKKTTRQY